MRSVRMLTDVIRESASPYTAEEGACVRDREEVERKVRVDACEHATEGEVC